MLNFKKALSTPIAIGIVLVFAIVVFGGVYSYKLLQLKETERIAKQQMPLVKAPKTTTTPTSTIDTSDWQTYKNEEYGFEVKYPDGWKFEEEKGKDYFSIAFLDEKETFLTTIGIFPKSFYRDDFGENFSSIDEMRQYWEKENEADIKSGEISENEKPKEITVSQERALEYISSNSPVEKSFDIQVFILKGEKLFVVSQMSVTSTYILDQILSTFKFLD